MLMSGSAEDKKHNQHFTLFIGDFLCHVLVYKVFVPDTIDGCMFWQYGILL